MRIAIVSDIHGNLTAFEAVIADLRLTSPDVVLHGGDLVHGGAHPAEIVGRIRALGWPGVCGNTDKMLWNRNSLTDYAAKFPKLQSLLGLLDEMIPWTCAALGEDPMCWLQALPYSQRQGSVALVHASPDNLWQAPLPDARDAELRSVYGALRAQTVVYGHIHRPYVRQLGGQFERITVANTGSVSLSYDGDPRASYLLLDEGKPTIRRVEYDLERETKDLLNSAMPHASWVSQLLRAGRYVTPSA
jgi:predicted phosphodiesterase